MFFIPVSCANILIISRISATAADVRTSKPRWDAVFLYVHRLGSCEKCPLARRWRGFSRRWGRFSRKWCRFSRRWCRFSRRWCRFHFRAETCAARISQKADSCGRFRPYFGTCAVDTLNLRRPRPKVLMYVHRNRAEMPFFCTNIGGSAFPWPFARRGVEWNSNSALQSAGGGRVRRRRTY